MLSEALFISFNYYIVAHIVVGVADVAIKLLVFHWNQYSFEKID